MVALGSTNLSERIANITHGSAVGPELVCDDHSRCTMAFHRFPQEP